MYAAACTGMYVRLAARCPWWPNGVSDVFIDQVTDTCIVFLLHVVLLWTFLLAFLLYSVRPECKICACFNLALFLVWTIGFLLVAYPRPGIHFPGEGV